MSPLFRTACSVSTPFESRSRCPLHKRSSADRKRASRRPRGSVAPARRRTPACRCRAESRLHALARRCPATAAVHHVRHVGKDAQQFRRRLHAHQFGDDGPLNRELCATNFVYPRRFISPVEAHGMWAGSHPVVLGLPEKTITGHRRNYHMERVGCISRRVGWDWSANRLFCGLRPALTSSYSPL